MATSKSQTTAPSRRDAVALLAGLAATPLAGSFGGALAQAGQTVDALLVNAAVSGPLREIIERLSGHRIKDGPFVSSTDNIAKLLAPGGGQRFDLFVGVSEFSRQPILGPSPGQEKVAAFDKDKVTHLNDLSEIGRADLVERDGKVFLIPVWWGYDMVLYNQDHVPENDPLTQSWGLMFDDKYAGRIAWFDVPHQMLMAAGLHLGMKEPEKASSAELDEMTKFLISRKKNVRTIWTTAAQAINLMASGEVVVSYGWIPIRVALQRQGHKVVNNWPSDGLLVWSHGAYVAKDSPEAEAAMAVVNAMLSPEYGSALSRETGYLSTNAKAEANFTPAERSAFGYDIRQRGVKTYGLKFPPDYAKWVEAWGKVKSA